MKKWSEEVWEQARPIVNEIKEQLFLQELAAGTLSEDRFRYYISQDEKYLDVYTRVLAHIASRLQDNGDVATFLTFALDGIAAEKELHANYNPDKDIEMSVACKFYTSYLFAQTHEDVAVAAAAVLPCFWVYLEVGKYILSIAKLEGNRYRAWIEAYSDPTFDNSTAKAIEVCDRLAASTTEKIRNQMTEAFLDATRLEHLFWQSAYNKGKRDTQSIDSNLN